MTNNYQRELGRLLKLSPIAPAFYTPTEKIKKMNHVAITASDKIIVSLGEEGNKESFKMAEALIENQYFKHLLMFNQESIKDLKVDIISGNDIDWQSSHFALAKKDIGTVEDGYQFGDLYAIVFIKETGITTAMCVNTSIARIFQDNSPELDDGLQLSSIAKEEATNDNRTHSNRTSQR